MAFRDICPTPIYEDETDQYLTGIPRVPTFNGANELARRSVDATDQIIDQIPELVRVSEVSRRHLAYFASVLDELAQNHPEAVERLTEVRRAISAELAGRIKPEEEAASTTGTYRPRRRIKSSL